MNTLKGQVKSIETEDDLILASITLNSCEFKAIVLREGSIPFEVGKPINVIFKETEVVLGTNDSTSVSIRNRVHGTIKEVEKGTLLSRITINTDEGLIIAIVTTEATLDLKLDIGASVQAMVKTNEVMLSN